MLYGALACTQHNLPHIHIHMLFMQVRDTLARIMGDQIAHHQLQLGRAASATSGSAPDGTAADEMSIGGAGSRAPTVPGQLLDFQVVRGEALRMVLEMVYARCFPDAADQAAVRALVGRHLLVSQSADEDTGPASIDASTPALLRVGSLYLAKGKLWSRMTYGAVAALIHCIQLEEVAAVS